ncbi:MAG: hypothetical protein AABX11_05545 [Nanoarchaeota archaeon]|mgnify:CR=1 FL=1
MNKFAIIEPINMIMACVTLLGAILILIGKGDYGLIALIIATLFEAMARVMK